MAVLIGCAGRTDNGKIVIDLDIRSIAPTNRPKNRAIRLHSKPERDRCRKSSNGPAHNNNKRIT